MVVLLVSCNKDDKPTDTIKSNTTLLTSKLWVKDHTELCNEYILASNPRPEYAFNSDKTFTYVFSAFNWRNEGTWELSDNETKLSLEYITYTNIPSGIKHDILTIFKLTESELILKEAYNDTTFYGEYCEYKYDYFK